MKDSQNVANLMWNNQSKTKTKFLLLEMIKVMISRLFLIIIRIIVQGFKETVLKCTFKYKSFAFKKLLIQINANP